MAKRPTKKKPKVDLSKIAKDLASTLKEDHVVQLDDRNLTQSRPHISTGSVALDYLIGGRENENGVRPCPGIPRGTISMIYGLPGSGKTTIALQTCASVIAEGGTALYIDWENEVDPMYASKLGVPVTDQSRFVLVQPDTLETGIKYMLKMAQGGVDLVVVDSVGAAVPQSVFERKVDDVTPVAALTRKWSDLLPKIKKIISKYNVALIGISQLRETIGGMGGFGGGPTRKPQGGNAWRFMNSLQIMLRVVGAEKGKVWNPIQGKYVESVVGSKVRAKLDKCKVSNSLKHEMDFFLLSGVGVDNSRTVVELGVNTGIVKKKGAWFSWVSPSGEVRAQGLNSFLDAINDHVGDLFTEVKPYLSDPTKKVESEESITDEVDTEGAVTDGDIEDLLNDL